MSEPRIAVMIGEEIDGAVISWTARVIAESLAQVACDAIDAQPGVKPLLETERRLLEMGFGKLIQAIAGRERMCGYKGIGPLLDECMQRRPSKEAANARD